jgi:DNA (cytosine-5)-methyltransferase 1
MHLHSQLSFVDLFAGIGGLRLAAEKVGARCVFTSEWDDYARMLYEANFRDNREIAGDIREVDESTIPPHDLLLAGFPCQPFSIAGVSKANALGRKHGFEHETQGNLFYDVARILSYHRPKAFLLENVKNLVSHDKGKTFKIIMKVLEEDLGYHVQSRVIEARHFLPQRRPRIVIVGFREKSVFDFANLGLPEKDTKRLRDILHPQDGTEAIDPRYTAPPFGTVLDKFTLTDNLWRYLQGYKEKHASQGNGFGFGLVGPDDIARTLSARYYKDGSEILIDQGSKNPRRLTPRECARLMGFPDSYKINVSDMRAYKAFGNSVAVPVFEAVLREVMSIVVNQSIRPIAAAE